MVMSGEHKMKLVGPPSARDTFMDRVYGWRDRMLARPAFHRWVARFPLTRGFARKKERELFNIIAGFVHTQVLTACVQTGLLRLLAKGPKTLDEIAAATALPMTGADRLVRAAVSLDLLSNRTGERYGLGDLGAAVATTPAFAAVLEHNRIFYRDLLDPVHLLRNGASGTQLSSFWAYAHSDVPASLSSNDVAAYTDFMAASQALIAEDVLDAYDVSQHRQLLDVGGGNGTFLAAAARRAPKLDLVLFDLPSVSERARERLSDCGLSQRVRIVGGDFHTDDLPAGADCVTLNRVLLDHDDTTAGCILERVSRAIAPGGTLLIAETIAGGPEADAYFGFYLMAMGRGRARDFETLARLATGSGFTNVQRVRTYRPTLTSVIAARKSRKT